LRLAEIINEKVMKTILITGATGNVGMEVIKNLSKDNVNVKVLAGVREEAITGQLFDKYNVESIYFDFDNKESIEKAFSLSDIVFLLRPPQLADVKKYFQPVIEIAVQKKINHIVFLSVQGAETSSFIPHHKIEKLIEESGINYTFLRPAYFFQNFTTTLRRNLIENQRIYLPAGKSKFTVIDVEDLGVVSSLILADPAKHINKAYDLTNDEKLSFGEMADILTKVLDKKIIFKSPDLISFYLNKRREKIPSMFVLVMIMLHYLPRLKPTPETSNWVKIISGKEPKNFREFVESNQQLLK
jgi:uncharacterized protein YbjT (DUF2867 family)